jgi:hypothetical protein
MAEPDEISTEDLRKAVLNVADAVRMIAASVDVFVLRLARVWPLRDYPEVAASHSELHRSLLASNERLSAAVDLLVKTDDEHSS